MNDLISRKAAIEAIDNEWRTGYCSEYAPSEIIDISIEALEQVPAAEPERKTGQWECGDDMWERAICSICKWNSEEAWEYPREHFKFCPNCGAKMEVEKHE